MKHHAVSLAHELARLVVESLVKIGLSSSDVLEGPIEFDALPWQTPPLVLTAPAFGVPLGEYFEHPFLVKPDPLVSFYNDTMIELRQHPAKVVSIEGYYATSYFLPDLKHGERLIRLSVPEGFPQISEYAGITLSLECAHLLKGRVKMEAFVSDDSNYYADLGDGLLVGVKDGLPTMNAQQWDLPVDGVVQELLTTPRGSITEQCEYDLIAKIRSVAHKHRAQIKDYEAVDWSIQTLRTMQGHGQMLQAVRRMKEIHTYRASRMQALSEALEVVSRRSITDRQRVETLKQLLVPQIISPGQFSKLLYSFHTMPPPILKETQVQKMQACIAQLHADEHRLYALDSPTPNP